VAHLQVVKRSGEREEFDPSKTKRAIMRVGLSDQEAELVLRRLEQQLYDGISTEEIYRRVHQLLDGRRATKYSLKKAIQRLGPEGENFEWYVSRIFQAEGFRTQNRLMLDGKCVPHETDILMEKAGERTIVECKFHNSLGLKCSIQIALYCYARFLDLSPRNQLDRICLVTNTRFSEEVVRYADCVGMGLLGWRHPEGEGIEQLAERHQLYPVTMLEMARTTQSQLLAGRFILVNDILARLGELQTLLPAKVAEDLEAQANALLGSD
jgi:hypothetical protein